MLLRACLCVSACGDNAAPMVISGFEPIYKQCKCTSNPLTQLDLR